MGSNVYDLSDNRALYEVLGVPRTATDKDIRRAYLKLVVLYHPDKNPDGEEIFKEICFAHGVLSDPEQRAMYDNKSLRQNLQGRAKEYDPTMDPHVQLSPEDLRKFVEKMGAEQASKQQNQSAFDRLMEEEVQRRAEYDAKNPAFKAQYELQRRQRQSQASAAASSSQRPSPPPPSSHSSSDATPSASKAALVTKGTGLGLKGYRTSAELTQKLEEDERNRLYGVPPTTGASTVSPSGDSASGLTVRQQMMSKYRTEQAMMASGGSTTSSHGSGTPSRTTMTTTKLDFVKEQNEKGFYTESVDDAIRTYSHFDYLDYVAADRRDQEPIAGAVIADALDSYVRKREDPRALD